MIGRSTGAPGVFWRQAAIAAAVAATLSPGGTSADESELRLEAAAAPPPAVSAARTATLGECPLDLAFLGRHLVVLGAEAVTLWEIAEERLRRRSDERLPAPYEAVRAPGGMLLAAEADSAVWAQTSRAPRAILFAVEGERLVPRQQAEALPYPGSTAGLRYRAGTNLLEGSVDGPGSGPFLALTAPLTRAAVWPDGELWWDGAAVPPDLRVGSSVAALGPRLLAAASSVPPGPADSILLLARDDSGARIAASIPVRGAIRALAARTQDDHAQLAAAVEAAPGDCHLLTLRLQPEPR